MANTTDTTSSCLGAWTSRGRPPGPQTEGRLPAVSSQGRGLGEWPGVPVISPRVSLRGLYPHNLISSQRTHLLALWPLRIGGSTCEHRRIQQRRPAQACSPRPGQAAHPRRLRHPPPRGCASYVVPASLRGSLPPPVSSLSCCSSTSGCIPTSNTLCTGSAPLNDYCTSASALSPAPPETS